MLRSILKTLQKRPQRRRKITKEIKDKSKQPKKAKILPWSGQFPRSFFKMIETLNMQTKLYLISILSYTMIKMQNISATLRTFLFQLKKFMKKLYTKKGTSKTITSEVLSKIPLRKKISKQHLTFVD